MKWNNGSNSWVVLKDLKDTFLVQIAEYAVQLQTRKSFGQSLAINWGQNTKEGGQSLARLYTVCNPAGDKLEISLP